MIPKIIHYCWFGKGSKSEQVQKCIDSWKIHLPGYVIKEWNEQNFDVNSVLYVKEAYTAKKYAFVSDYVRLYALYNEGGIYMDTDIEVIKNFDDLLINVSFIGFEDIDCIGSGVMGAKKGEKWLYDNMEYYHNRHFRLAFGILDVTTNVRIITKYMQKKSLVLNNKYQRIDSQITIYPKDYFCPKSWKTQEICCTDNTYCIHHFECSWGKTKTWEEKVRIYLHKIKIFFLVIINGIVKK